MMRNGAPDLGLLFTHVILNGGEAGVRDRTNDRSFDVVDGDVQDACSVRDLGYRIAALRVS